MEDGFSPESEIQIPPVSPLLAMGTSPSRFGRRWIIAIGALFGLLLAGICFTLLCSATFSLPTDTVFFATARPKVLDRLLTTEQKNSLPTEWLTTIQEKSSWPIVFGLARKGLDLQPFVIGPRWAVPKPLLENQAETKYFVRQIGLSSNNPTSKEMDVVYRDHFFSHVFQAGSVQGWFDPSIFFANRSPEGQIRFFFDKDRLTLNDKREETSSAKPPSVTSASRAPLQTDLSLHLAALTTTIPSDVLLAALPLGELTPLLASLKHSPTVINASFSDTSLTTLQLEFDQPLQTKEQAVLRSFLEQTIEKELLTLPDGTVAVEQIASQPGSEFSSSTLVTPALADWRTTSSAPTLAATPCASGTWLVRISPTLVARLIPAQSRFSAWLSPQPLQMWQTETGSVICRES